jgi:hypothetical protein
LLNSHILSLWSPTQFPKSLLFPIAFLSEREQHICNSYRNLNRKTTYQIGRYATKTVVSLSLLFNINHSACRDSRCFIQKIQQSYLNHLHSRWFSIHTKKSRGFSPLVSTGFYNFSLPTLFDKAQKKRTRTPSSKRPKTPTEYRSRGFGTQWGHRDSNPRPSD